MGTLLNTRKSRRKLLLIVGLSLWAVVNAVLGITYYTLKGIIEHDILSATVTMINVEAIAGALLSVQVIVAIVFVLIGLGFAVCNLLRRWVNQVQE